MAKDKKIYLADDDSDDRLLLIEAIKTIDAEIEIIEAEDGQELLTILQSDTFLGKSLIILDMNMPKMNGLETLASIRNIPKLATSPAIMLSTSNSTEMIQFAKQLGAVNYFVKPTTMDGLINLSRQLILENL